MQLKKALFIFFIAAISLLNTFAQKKEKDSTNLINQKEKDTTDLVNRKGRDSINLTNRKGKDTTSLINKKEKDTANLANGKEKDTSDLMNQLEKQMVDSPKSRISYTIATFKTTRLVNGHSIENVGKGVMDVKISHRFGTLNNGGYELFGLDNATMRMGLDYGITGNLMVGIGRSTYKKTYDAFLKVKLLRQSTGEINMPISVSYLPAIALQTLKFADPDRKNLYSSRLFYTHQLLIARKFSDQTSIQLMPTLVHRNLVTLSTDPNNIWAIGIGARQSITKRTSFNIEYYYQLPGHKLPGSTNSLSAGFDIVTGGHVFQLHFTNSMAMDERGFISETTGKWQKGDVLFGFNISRVFTIGKSH